MFCRLTAPCSAKTEHKRCRFYFGVNLSPLGLPLILSLNGKSIFGVEFDDTFVEFAISVVGSVMVFEPQGFLDELFHDGIVGLSSLPIVKIVRDGIEATPSSLPRGWGGVNGFHHLGRIAFDEGVGWEVALNDTARTDNGVVANGRAFQDDGVEPYPHIVPYKDGTGRVTSCRAVG